MKIIKKRSAGAVYGARASNILRIYLILHGLFSCSLTKRDDIAETVPHFLCDAVEQQDAATQGVREVRSVYTKCKKYYILRGLL